MQMHGDLRSGRCPAAVSPSEKNESVAVSAQENAQVAAPEGIPEVMPPMVLWYLRNSPDGLLFQPARTPSFAPSPLSAGDTSTVDVAHAAGNVRGLNEIVCI